MARRRKEPPANAEKPSPEQDPATGRFVAGNSGNGGRPKGSRNKLGEEFIRDLYADWTEHGVDAIKAVRASKPDAYLKVIASLLPKELNVRVGEFDELSDEQLDRRIRELAAEFLEVGASQAARRKETAH